jgi:hypothetical protein
MLECPFEHVRRYCERKGWNIVPVAAQKPHVTTFEYKHSQYVLTFNGQNITSITKDGGDISWQELPDVLKGLI